MKKLYLKSLHTILPRHTRVYDSFSHRMPHYTYPINTMKQISYTHSQPISSRDKIAHFSVKLIRKTYDYITNYDLNNMSQNKWIKRCIFLQTVAGVPGMVGGMCRHLRSLRTMQRDNGWIHHLLEQADNQRFHLIIFLNFKKPTILQRAMIITIQGIFMNSFFLAYIMNPKICHKFVGYLQQQAVKTYTAMLQQIESPTGVLHHWSKIPAPKDVIQYYHLNDAATFKQVIMSIRADEACHRETNHFFAEIDPSYDIQEENVVVYNKEKEQQENELKKIKQQTQIKQERKKSQK